MDKRYDLPRTRLSGTIHDVMSRVADEEWLRSQGYWEKNWTKCGLAFRHATLPETYLTTCMECLSMTEVEYLKYEAARFKEDHASVCKLVALMHAAAVGEIRGPIRGVVEDVSDLRSTATAAQKRVAELERALAAAQHEIGELRMLCLSA